VLGGVGGSAGRQGGQARAQGGLVDCGAFGGAVEQQRGAARDLVQVPQVELVHARRPRPAEPCRGSVATACVAHGEHDVCAARDQGLRGLEADAAVRARHDDRVPDEAGLPGHVVIAILPRTAPDSR
jgi:hypothetical protein